MHNQIRYVTIEKKLRHFSGNHQSSAKNGVKAAPSQNLRRSRTEGQNANQPNLNNSGIQAAAD